MSRVTWWFVVIATVLLVLVVTYLVLGGAGPLALLAGAGASQATAEGRRLLTKIRRSELEFSLEDARSHARAQVWRQSHAASESDRLAAITEADKHARRATAIESRIAALDRKISPVVALFFVSALVAVPLGAAAGEACPAPTELHGKPGCWLPIWQWDARTERTELLRQALSERRGEATEARRAHFHAVRSASVASALAEIHRLEAYRLRRRITELEKQLGAAVREIDPLLRAVERCHGRLPPWLTLVGGVALTAGGVGLGMLSCGSGPEVIVTR